MTIFPKKDPKVRYVDMAIYIDNHVYDKDRDDGKIYEYLCLLYQMLAIKDHMFNNPTDYQNFSFMAATRMYYRLINPKQFLPADDPKKLKQIKSCLNYMKMTLYPCKVDYQRDYFCGVIDEDVTEEENTLKLQQTATEKVQCIMKPMMEAEIASYFQNISQTVKAFINSLPYRTDSCLTTKLYVSCLLTLINQITWPNSYVTMIKRRLSLGVSVENIIDRIYTREKYKPAILFHLPQEFSNYVYVITNELKTIVGKELSELLDMNEPTDEVIKHVLASGYNNAEDRSLDD